MQSKLPWLLASVAIVPAAFVAPAQAAVHRFHDDHVLGTSLDFAVVGADAGAAARALGAARAEIARLDAVLSGWRGDSELSRLNASTGSMRVSEDLYRVIAACEAWRAQTAGAFSARLGTVEAGWRAAETEGALSDPAALAAIAERAETAPVRLDPAARSIDRAGVVFAVDALAKGYVIDAALDAAARAAPQAKGLMLDIGGDLRCRGQAPDPAGWRIGLAQGSDADNLAPLQAIRLADRAVATSGPGARDRVIGGQSFVHTLSPRTGGSAGGTTASVVAGTAADADALATALSVMPAEQALTLAEGMPGVEARLIGSDGAVSATSGWDNLLAPAPPAGRVAPNPAALIRVAARAAPAWPSGYEVDIDYTIPDLALGRYRPPFVAIWITDERGALVRTLFHLGNRPRRYLDSNYIWWRAFDGAGQSDQLFSVTRPSRPPGRYSAVWDGRDDNGALVGQGRYTVNIETTREHGGHSYQTIPLDLGAKPASGAAGAQTEAGPAAARYGPTGARPGPSI